MDNYFGYYKPKAVIAIIAILAIAIFIAKENFELSVSILSAIGSFIFIINKWLWKYKPFLWLYRVPDFSGRYEGIIKYHYRDEDGKRVNGMRKCAKIIYQTGTKINIYSFTYREDGTPSSKSVNKGMYVEDVGDGMHFRLIYNYLNDGCTNQEFPPHYGTTIIKFINDKQPVLSGRYYTERNPFQTKGKYIELKKVSDNLTHIF